MVGVDPSAELLAQADQTALARGCNLTDSVVTRGYLPADEVERLTSEFHNLQVVYV